MNQDEAAAYDCLGKTGHLSDPKYSSKPEKQEAKLKEDCRRCWQHRKHFPVWIQGYISRWSIGAKVGAERVSDKAVEGILG